MRDLLMSLPETLRTILRISKRIFARITICTYVANNAGETEKRVATFRERIDRSRKLTRREYYTEKIL